MTRRSGDPWERILAGAVSDVKDELQDARESFRGESPIEDIFYAALKIAGQYGSNEVRYVRDAANREEAMLLAGDSNNKDSLIVESQVQIENWRVDFLVWYFDWNRNKGGERWRAVIVECDGHDFHERTKKQAARDRQRDRESQLNGIPVLRFTGSELWNDPWGCALEVIAWMQRGL